MQILIAAVILGALGLIFGAVIFEIGRAHV